MTKMAKTDERINNVFSYIEGYINNYGYPPSVREICRDLSIKSTATCHCYLKKLEDRGLITVGGNKKRAIMLTKPKADCISVPLVGSIAAGAPILAVENLEEYYPLSRDFESSAETFMLNVRGDSMKEIGIFNGDKVIIRKQETAENGEIIAALVDDSATVKRFFKRDGKFILHPENAAYDDIIVDDVIVLGKVIGLIRKY